MVKSAWTPRGGRLPYVPIEDDGGEWESYSPSDGKGKGGSQGLVATTPFAFPTSQHCNHLRVPVAVGKGTILCSSHYGWTAPASGEVDAGIYLDQWWLSRLGIVGHRIRSALGYPALILHWPDRGIPKAPHLSLALQWANEYLSKGGKVELSCIGGHGRTGTLLACLLREVNGMTGKGAIDTVRREVCKSCIETKEQEGFILQWGT